MYHYYLWAASIPTKKLEPQSIFCTSNPGRNRSRLHNGQLRYTAIIINENT